MKYTFNAIPSGDYECFCFAVDEDVFTFIKKKKPDVRDKNKFHEGKYNLYTSDLFPIGFEKNVKIEFEWSRLK